MVKALWSEASRRMAHNLDDTYERWKMRRETMSYEEQTQDLDRYSDILVQTVDVAAITDTDGCEMVKAALLDSYAYIQGKRTQREHDRSSYLSKSQIKQINVEVHTLTYLLTKIGLEVRKVNARRAEINRTKVTAGKDRNKKYVKFLQASLLGILEEGAENAEFDYRTAIHQLLEYGFQAGDRALFGNWEQEGDEL